MSKKNILSLSTPDLKTQCEAHGLKGFIASQIMDWVYKKKVVSFSDMNNISKKNQEALDSHFTILPFKSVSALHSKEDNAIKCMIALEDNSQVECVILKEKSYYTLCVSSQCGCPVDCKFCLTGVAGFKRNLTDFEIIAQVLYANSLGYDISHLVFMGMGEPLLNLDHVISSINIMNSDDRFNISKRKITVSTSGYIAGIRQLVKQEFYVNLAFSVGTADPIKREAFMPIEKRNPILQVAKEIKAYQKLHNRKLTLEYTLLAEKNDGVKDIEALINLAKYLDAKINLINLNPHAKIPFKPVSSAKLKTIRESIRRQDVPVTVRYRKGQDIAAACGQLGESIIGAEGKG